MMSQAEPLIAPAPQGAARHMPAETEPRHHHAPPPALREVSLGLTLILIWAFFAATRPTFLSPRNLSNLAVELSITAVVSLGMLLVIVAGHIDLSVGSGVGLFGGITTVLMFRHGWPAAPAMGVSLVFGVIIWAAMGW